MPGGDSEVSEQGALGTIAKLLTIPVFTSFLAMTRLHVKRSNAYFWSQVDEMRYSKKHLCAALRSRRHRAQVLCDILGVHQPVTAARNDHRHSRRKAGGNATWSGKRTITFPVASEVLEHSQQPTAVSIFCRQFVSSSLWLWWCLRCIRLLCFAEFVIFFLLSHTLNSSLRLPFRHRADTRRELTELQPFNLTHVLADEFNGKDFNEVFQNTRASQ